MNFVTQMCCCYGFMNNALRKLCFLKLARNYGISYVVFFIHIFTSNMDSVEFYVLYFYSKSEKKSRERERKNLNFLIFCFYLLLLSAARNLLLVKTLTKSHHPTFLAFHSISPSTLHIFSMLNKNLLKINLFFNLLNVAEKI